mmetsp:Transcript_112480/g.298817  ORF Transcript_112480/g.298817 Transcript_112480/m.298817 type:complete len:335 (+) Transcript_112480:1597-2601(+)
MPNEPPVAADPPPLASSLFLAAVVTKAEGFLTPVSRELRISKAWSGGICRRAPSAVSSRFHFSMARCTSAFLAADSLGLDGAGRPPGDPDMPDEDIPCGMPRGWPGIPIIGPGIPCEKPGIPGGGPGMPNGGPGKPGIPGITPGMPGIPGGIPGGGGGNATPAASTPPRPALRPGWLISLTHALNTYAEGLRTLVQFLRSSPKMSIAFSKGTSCKTPLARSSRFMLRMMLSTSSSISRLDMPGGKLLRKVRPPEVEGASVLRAPLSAGSSGWRRRTCAVTNADGFLRPSSMDSMISFASLGKMALRQVSAVSSKSNFLCASSGLKFPRSFFAAV